MEQKKPTSDNIYKELGSLQEKVLINLAKNPDQHKQAILKSIQHPQDQYGSIVNAVEALEKMALIKAEPAISQKKVKIKTYSCTSLGIYYALTKIDSLDLLTMLQAYESRIEVCKTLIQFYNVWGRDSFAIYMKDAAEVFPLMEKEGFYGALPYLLLKAQKYKTLFDEQTRKRNAKGTLKASPQTKEVLKRVRDDIDELLKE